MDLVVERFSLKNLLLAVGVLVFGIALVLAGVFGDFTLEVSGFVLPKWSIFVLGGLAIVVSIALALAGSRTQHCAQCNSELEEGEVSYPLDSEATIMQAVRSKALEALRSLAVSSDEGEHIHLSLRWCPEEHFGTIEITRHDRKGEQALAESTVITGAAVGLLIELEEAYRRITGKGD